MVCWPLLFHVGLRDTGCPLGVAGTPEPSHPGKWPGQTEARLEPNHLPQTWHKGNKQGLSTPRQSDRGQMQRV